MEYNLAIKKTEVLTHGSMDPEKHAKWKKADTEGIILYGSIII